jgi:hypothetical protein
MQRARDRIAVNDALRKRAAFVRAAIVQREHFIVSSPEQCDIAVVALDDAAAQARNVGDAANMRPDGGSRHIHVIGNLKR